MRVLEYVSVRGPCCRLCRASDAPEEHGPCCRGPVLRQIPVHPSQNELFKYGQALKEMSAQLRAKQLWHEWVGPYRLPLRLLARLCLPMALDRVEGKKKAPEQPRPRKLSNPEI